MCKSCAPKRSYSANGTHLEELLGEETSTASETICRFGHERKVPVLQTPSIRSNTACLLGLETACLKSHVATAELQNAWHSIGAEGSAEASAFCVASCETQEQTDLTVCTVLLEFFDSSVGMKPLVEAKRGDVRFSCNCPKHVLSCFVQGGSPSKPCEAWIPMCCWCWIKSCWIKSVSRRSQCKQCQQHEAIPLPRRSSGVACDSSLVVERLDLLDDVVLASLQRIDVLFFQELVTGSYKVQAVHLEFRALLRKNGPWS